MKTIPIRLTTETVEQQNVSGANPLLSGTRLNPSTRTIELVGTSTTSESGGATDAGIYVVLSGTFDQLPALE